MLYIVIPIFMVIFAGYLFGRIKPNSGNADTLLNDYVMYISLPALLFLALANANIEELRQWGFIFSTLGGISVTYVISAILSQRMGIALPQSSILSMGASYGTTGYMGVPLLISAYGDQAALPAAIATILHNIPTIMAVIISWDLFSSRHSPQGLSLLHSIGKAARTTFTNPLTLAVLTGLIFSFFHLTVPTIIQSFAHFLGMAAGPTALFALGLGLSRINIANSVSNLALKIMLPTVALKLMLQPALTFVIAYFLFDMQKEANIWLATAIVMAAQPIGAGVYIFAKKYEYKQEVISLSIITSLLIALVTLPMVLSLFVV